MSGEESKVRWTFCPASQKKFSGSLCLHICSDSFRIKSGMADIIDSLLDITVVSIEKNYKEILKVTSIFVHFQKYGSVH